MILISANKLSKPIVSLAKKLTICFATTSPILSICIKSLNEAFLKDSKLLKNLAKAAAVVSQYCDMVGIRAFASLNSKEKWWERNCS